MADTREELRADVARLDRLISKADGDTGFNEPFLNYLDNEDALETYHELDRASDDDLSKLVAAMQNYINGHKLNV